MAVRRVWLIGLQLPLPLIEIKKPYFLSTTSSQPRGPERHCFPLQLIPFARCISRTYFVIHSICLSVTPGTGAMLPKRQ